MYTLLLDNTNTFYTTSKEIIYQRSSMVDCFHILVPRYYNDMDMTEFECTMEYLLPVSKKIKTVTMVLNSSDYSNEDVTGNSDTNTYLEYTQPFTPEFTSEAGTIQLSLTFVKTEAVINDDNTTSSTIRVRKTGIAKINISSLEFWQDIVPDAALSAVDAKIATLQTLMEEYNALAQTSYNNMPRDLEVTSTNTENNLHMVSLNGKVGSGVDVNLLSPDAIDDLGFDENGTLHVTSKGRTMGDGVDVAVLGTEDDFDDTADGIIDLSKVVSNLE